MNEKIKDIFFKVWIFLSTLIILMVVFFIFGYIIKNGIHVLSREFLFDGPKGMPVGSEGGIFPAIIGSLYLMLIASIFAFILSLSTSIYILFYSKSERLKRLTHLIIQCMAGVPSIILGLFGYTLFVLYLGFGRSLLAGGVTLGIMIFPYMEVNIEKSLAEVDESIIKSSYALGVSKIYTIFKVILPICKKDIISTLTLSGGYAMGATAPIILTSAVIFAPVPNSVTSPVMALPFHLYILTNQGISLEKAYGTALVLILLLLIINILAILIKNIGEKN